MRFDWYQGTILASEKEVISALASAFPDQVNDADSLAKKYHYGTGFTLRNPSTRSEVKVLSGGRNGLRGTHFVSTGGSAEETSSIVRGCFPDSHHVTRADACQDLYSDGLFKKVVKVCRTVGSKYGLSAPFQNDPLNDLAGATQYLGAPTSDYRLRVYQKGLQLLNSTALHDCGSNPPTRALQEDLSASTFYRLQDGSMVPLKDVVRVEAQIRPPTKHGKQLLATIDPEQCFAFSPWLCDFAKKVFQLELDKFDIRGQKVSDFDHKLKWMLKSYSGVIQEIIDLYGADGAGEFLQHQLNKARSRN